MRLALRGRATLHESRASSLAPSRRLIPVTAELVAIFVFGADLHSGTSAVLIVITSFVIVPMRAPVATHRPVILILVPHSPHIGLAHIVLAHATHALAVALLRFPITADLDIFGRLAVLFSGLLRLLRAALWLNGRDLGLVGRRRASVVLSERGSQHRR